MIEALIQAKKKHQPENRTEVLRDWSYCCGDALARHHSHPKASIINPPAPPAASNSSVRSLRDWDARANTGDDKPRRFPDQAFPKRISGVRILKGHTTFGCLCCLSLEENRVKSRDSSGSKWLKWLKSILITRFSSNFDPSRLMYSTPHELSWCPPPCSQTSRQCRMESRGVEMPPGRLAMYFSELHGFGGLNTWWDYRNIT